MFLQKKNYVFTIVGLLSVGPTPSSFLHPSPCLSGSFPHVWDPEAWAGGKFRAGNVRQTWKKPTS